MTLINHFSEVFKKKVQDLECVNRVSRFYMHEHVQILKLLLCTCRL